MRKINYSLPLIFLFFCSASMWAIDTVHVKQTKIPILIEREDNVLFYFRIDALESEMLNELKLKPSNNTTEAQVAEVAPRDLMLNTRDNRGGSRAVATTTDLRQTWSEHPSSRSVLQEPVCMVSLIKVEAKENAFGKDIVLFSNPNTTNGLYHITIKASMDGGLSFPSEYDVLLDEAHGWGYSCLTLIDIETVGILYESSVAHMTFQAVPLKDILEQH